MFAVSDPEAFWLNVTNIALGVVTLALFLMFVFMMGRELGPWLRRCLRWRRRTAGASKGSSPVRSSPLFV